MELSEIIKIQKEFDSQHKVNFNWADRITGDDSSQLQFLTIALMGEVGEMANCVKKIMRGDMQFEEQKSHIADELIDVFIYTIKLAYQMDIDLEAAYLKKLEYNKKRFEQFKTIK